MEYYVKRKNEDFLEHHGILGQKWGVKNGPPYPLDSDVSTGSRLKKSDQSKNSEYFKEIKNEKELMEKNKDNLNKWGSYDYDFNGLTVVARRADQYTYNKKKQKLEYKDFIVDPATSLERRKKEEEALKKLNEKDVLTQLYKAEANWLKGTQYATLDDFLKETKIADAYVSYSKTGSDRLIELSTDWLEGGHVYSFVWYPETNKIDDITFNG